MVQDMKTALHALHEVLVAARNMGFEISGAPAVLMIVDSVEVIPIWMADPNVDRTDDIIRVLNGLASEYPECGIAAATASRPKG